MLTVPESYIRRLEAENAQLRQSFPKEQPDSTTVIHGPSVAVFGSNPASSDPPLRAERLMENSTTEHFVSKLKGIHDTCMPDTPGHGGQVTPTPYDDTGDEFEERIPSNKSNYTFIPLQQDNNRA